MPNCFVIGNDINIDDIRTILLYLALSSRHMLRSVRFLMRFIIKVSNVQRLTSTNLKLLLKGNNAGLCFVLVLFLWSLIIYLLCYG